MGSELMGSYFFLVFIVNVNLAFCAFLCLCFVVDCFFVSVLAKTRWESIQGSGEENQDDKKSKIVFIGDQYVGKTSVITRFIKNTFEN